VRLTQNPFQRGAAACAFTAAIMNLAGAPALSLLPLGLGVVLAAVAYVRRHHYPR